MKQYNLKTQFVVCIKNEGYAASLELHKIYPVIYDSNAVEHHLIRILDESSEDYLYPADYFVPIKLPHAVKQALTPAR